MNIRTVLLETSRTRRHSVDGDASAGVMLIWPLTFDDLDLLTNAYSQQVSFLEEYNVGPIIRLPYKNVWYITLSLSV